MAQLRDPQDAGPEDEPEPEEEAVEDLTPPGEQEVEAAAEGLLAPVAEEQLPLAPEPAAFYLPDGTSIPTDQALENYREWTQWAAQNRAGLEALREISEGRASIVPRTQPDPRREAYQEPDPYAYPPDEATQRMQAELAQLRQQLGETRAISEQNRQQMVAQSVAMATTVVGAAEERFATDRNLSQAEMETLRTHTAALNLINPHTVGPNQTRMEGVQTVLRALETAYWDMPQFRERELGLRAEQERVQNERRTRQAAIGGTCGSVPRSVPKPKTREDRVDAIASAVAELQRGTID